MRWFRLNCRYALDLSCLVISLRTSKLGHAPSPCNCPKQVLSGCPHPSLCIWIFSYTLLMPWLSVMLLTELWVLPSPHRSTAQGRVKWDRSRRKCYGVGPLVLQPKWLWFLSGSSFYFLSFIYWIWTKGFGSCHLKQSSQIFPSFYIKISWVKLLILPYWNCPLGHECHLNF